MVSHLSYCEAVDFLMKKGFDGVEIASIDKQFQFRDEFFEEDFPEKMKAAMEAAGVKGFSVSAHKDYTLDEETFEGVKKTIEIGKKLGSKYVIINGAVIRDGEDYDEQYKAMYEKTAELAAYAESLDIRLAIEYEPHFVVGNTPQLLEFIEKIGSPALGINCDIGHVFLCDSDPLQAIADSAPYILQCHVENMAAGVHDHLVPWEGDMDLKAYIGKLKEIGFDGGLGLDLYHYEYGDVCGQCVEYLRNIM